MTSIQNDHSDNSNPNDSVENTKSIGLHAHWDCFSGAAGDMMLAACLDAAAFNDSTEKYSSTCMSSEELLKKIETSIKLGLPDMADEFHMECKRVWRGSGSITAIHVNVNSKYQHEPVSVPKPAHSNGGISNVQNVTSLTLQHHNHGHEHHHNHQHSNVHIHGHINETSTPVSHTHDHDHHHHHRLPIEGEDTSSISHQHAQDHDVSKNDHVRNLPEIRDMLTRASETYIPQWVNDHAIAAFTELAYAEAAVHGTKSIDDVHFHEVGAIDSIVDTVGTLLALYYLNVTSVSCSRLPLGEGMVSTAHGILPVPAPATLRLMTGMPITSGPPGRTGELVTPTAASLLRVLVHRPHNGRAPNMSLKKVGIGAGTKDFANHPNIIRLLIGETIESKQ